MVSRPSGCDDTASVCAYREHNGNHDSVEQTYRDMSRLLVASRGKYQVFLTENFDCFGEVDPMFGYGDLAFRVVP